MKTSPAASAASAAWGSPAASGSAAPPVSLVAAGSSAAASDTPCREPRRRGEGDRECPETGHFESFVVAVLDSRSGVSVSGTRDERLAAIAARQRGRVARRQLLAAGIRSGTVTRMLAGGRLLPRRRGVYAVGHAARAPWTRETEALLALRRGAALSHESALALWELRTPPPSLVHVSVPGSPAGRPAGVRVHRPGSLEPRDLRIRRGLPVTSPARTLLDLAPSLEPRELERALDEATPNGLVTERELQALVDRGAAGPPARRRMRTLLAARSVVTFTRSEAEERFLALIREAGLSMPLINVRRRGYELDFLWPEQRLAVEIDGFAFHGGRAAFERDRHKDAALLAAGGIVVTRVTWRQLTADALLTAVRVGQALASRAGGGRVH